MKSIKINRGKITISIKLLSVLIIVLFNLAAKSQENKNHSIYGGIGASSFLSGNGHGTFYSFYFNAYKGKNCISLGPCVQRCSQKMRSIKLSYSYKIADNEARLKLRVFSFISYVDKSPLSYTTITLEERQEKSDVKWDAKPVPTDWNKVKLSTLETGFGAEVGVKILGGMIIRSFIGLAVFYHTKYEQGMYSDRLGPELIIGTSFNVFNSR